MRAGLLILLCALAAGTLEAAPADAGVATRVRGSWTHGPPADDNYFPIAVWLQNPANASRFKGAGINLYIGLWRGPTRQQLDELARAKMPVICSQNAAGLENRDNRIIIGWMHGDEPDNAQSLGRDKGWGPPVAPEKIFHDYERMRAADPTRPILLNLGQGVAWDGWHGRGVRTNHPEDYPQYIRGCDIVSFDIYPVVHDHRDVAGRLEFVAGGVERLVKWSGGGTVWNCIECTHISNPKAKATADQVRAEVWMSIIRGSRGLIYFVHQFEPEFKEAALLDDPDQLAAVTAINKQIQELAPVVNSADVVDGVTVKSSVIPHNHGGQSSVPSASRPGENSKPSSANESRAVQAAEEALIAAVLKRHQKSRYVFAVSLRNQPAHATFSIRDAGPDGDAEVLGESRRIPIRDGVFADDFKPYGVHLYRFGAN